MKGIIKKISLLLFVCCLLIANLYVPTIVEAQTLRDLKNELARFQEDYEKNRLEKELSEQEKQKIKNTINEINQNISDANQQIIDLNAEIEKLNEEILKDEEEIKAILAFTQIQNGESAYLEYAFGAKDFTDFIYRLAVSEQITTYNDELIETNKRNIETNKQKTQELEQKKIDLAKKQAELKVEMDKIAVTVTEIESNMETIEGQITARKKDIAMYEDMGCGLDESIPACINRNRDVLPPDTQMWRPLQKGYVTGWYGMRWHPISGIWKMHYGMDISNYGANAGNTEVYSVANGRVSVVNNVYSTCGGVKIYIVHNINGVVYTSGYWHLNKAFVKEGDLVTKDTVIGTIAGYPDPKYGKSDGCSNGAHLHLEMSLGTWAENTYSTKRLGANTVINFPKTTYSQWTDKTRKY